MISFTNLKWDLKKDIRASGERRLVALGYCDGGRLRNRGLMMAAREASLCCIFELILASGAAIWHWSYT